MESNLIFGMGLVVLSTFTGSIGALFFKYTSEYTTKNLFYLLKEHTLYLGILFHVASILILVSSLKFGELSVLYPIAGLTHIWVSLLSIKFLNEKMTSINWFGIIMVVIGVFFIGLGA